MWVRDPVSLARFHAASGAESDQSAHPYVSETGNALYRLSNVWEATIIGSKKSLRTCLLAFGGLGVLEFIAPRGRADRLRSNQVSNGVASLENDCLGMTGCAEYGSLGNEGRGRGTTTDVQCPANTTEA